MKYILFFFICLLPSSVLGAGSLSAFFTFDDLRGARTTSNYFRLDYQWKSSINNLELSNYLRYAYGKLERGGVVLTYPDEFRYRLETDTKKRLFFSTGVESDHKLSDDSRELHIGGGLRFSPWKGATGQLSLELVNAIPPNDGLRARLGIGYTKKLSKKLEFVSAERVFLPLEWNAPPELDNTLIYKIAKGSQIRLSYTSQYHFKYDEWRQRLVLAYSLGLG